MEQEHQQNQPQQAQPPQKHERKHRRGFASMDIERQREISRRGGKAAHEKGTAHQFSADEAREAGRKGGQAVSKDREHMARIGRAGGRAKRTPSRSSPSA